MSGMFSFHFGMKSFLKKHYNFWHEIHISLYTLYSKVSRLGGLHIFEVFRFYRNFSGFYFTLMQCSFLMYRLSGPQKQHHPSLQESFLYFYLSANFKKILKPTPSKSPYWQPHSVINECYLKQKCLNAPSNIFQHIVQLCMQRRKCCHFCQIRPYQSMCELSSYIFKYFMVTNSLHFHVFLISFSTTYQHL